MEPVIKERPTSVTVIAWIFIVVAGLMVLSGGMGFMVHTYMQEVQESIPPIPEDLPKSAKVGSLIFQYFDILAFLQVIVAIIVLITSIQFLRLRAWARTALEIFSWLGLVYIVGFGIFWIYSWVSMTSNIPINEGTPGPPPMFNILGAVMGTVVMAVFAAPIVVIIKFLRGKTIREAVTKIQVEIEDNSG